MRRVTPALLLLLLVLPAPARAATAKGPALAASLKAKISETTGVQATKVTCPRRVAVRKGARTTCRVVFVTGDRTPADLRFKNATGDYRVKLRYLLLRNLENQIEGVFADQGATIEVTCPAGPRKVKKGDTFTCDAVDADGNTGIFDITQTGGGLAKYALRQA